MSSKNKTASVLDCSSCLKPCFGIHQFVDICIKIWETLVLSPSSVETSRSVSISRAERGLLHPRCSAVKTSAKEEGRPWLTWIQSGISEAFAVRATCVTKE